MDELSRINRRVLKATDVTNPCGLVEAACDGDAERNCLSCDPVQEVARGCDSCKAAVFENEDVFGTVRMDTTCYATDVDVRDNDVSGPSYEIGNPNPAKFPSPPGCPFPKGFQSVSGA